MMKTLIPLILQGPEKISKFLIDNGCDIDIRNFEGKTPLEIAAVRGKFVF